MKNILVLMILTFSIGCFAQENDNSNKQKRVFCQLLGTGKTFSNKVTITIDFGQEISFWKGASNQYLVDENGKSIKFNSMVDALNFMGKSGWEFEQAYVITKGSKNVYHYLLSKEITPNEEIENSILTKDKYNKEENGNKIEKKRAKKSIDDIYW